MSSEIRDLNYSVRDLSEAVPHYLGARFGIAGNGETHPLADDFEAQRITLAEVAKKIGTTVEAQKGKTPNSLQAIQAALSTDDFQDILGDSFRRLIHAEYEAVSDHRLIARVTSARDFRPVTFPRIDLDLNLANIGQVTEQRHTHAVTTAEGESGAVSSYGARIGVSRQSIVNDDIDLLGAVFRRLGAMASRLEAAEVFGVLENGPTLNDGNPLWNNANRITGAALDKSSLGEAMGMLRRQADGQEPGNFRPRYLAVPPEQEANALELTANLSNQRSPLDVIVNPNIDAGRWYLFADPSRTAVVALLRLDDRAGRPVDVGPIRSDRSDFDGIRFTVHADFGAAPVARVGAVRAEA